MSSLSAPNPTSQEKALAERQVESVLSVDLANPASRARAREAVEKLSMDSASAARSRLLERRILALAQADSGATRIATELEMLAARARELDATYVQPRRQGLLKLSPAPKKKPTGSPRDTINEIKGIVNSLSRSAEVLRQNHVAFDGFAGDLSAEHQRIVSDVERADDFKSALIAAIEKAKAEGAPSEVVRFAEREVLFPLESHRQYLQGLLAVNQQGALSLSILSETNEALITHVRMITLAARSSLDMATVLQRRASEQASVHANGEADSMYDMADLHESLGELFHVLQEHDAWHKESATKRRDAARALSELSAKVFDEGGSGVAS